MNSILDLFLYITSKFALATMFFPIVAVLIARKRNVELNRDLKLFEFYVYTTLSLQLFAYVLTLGLGFPNIILFRLYLPFHTVVFAYFLLKWLLGINKNTILLISFSLIISVSGDLIFDDISNFPYFMLVFDSVLLFILSFIVSFLNDKRKHQLSNEYNFIHIGIYLYSLLTLIGFTITQTGYMQVGFFLQAIAVIISNYYFARSFTCLFHSRG
ncbi:MAG: hypothetical protein GY936_08970 [Ignavibacteriae bacterium]|nr:hypothetical protein [Ignavibacteriota bacterium]